MSAENVTLLPTPGTDATISRTVKAIAKYQGKATSAIARDLGFSRSAFFARLNGTSHWSAEDVQRLADYLGVGVEVLFHGLPGLGQPDTPATGEYPTFRPVTVLRMAS